MKTLDYTLGSYYLTFLKESLKNAGIPYISLFELGYEPEYQGTLFMLITFRPQDKALEDLVSEVLGTGDDSYRISKIPDKYNHYLIDICQ